MAQLTIPHEWHARDQATLPNGMIVTLLNKPDFQNMVMIETDEGYATAINADYLYPIAVANDSLPAASPPSPDASAD